MRGEERGATHGWIGNQLLRLRSFSCGDGGSSQYKRELREKDEALRRGKNVASRRRSIR